MKEAQEQRKNNYLNEYIYHDKRKMTRFEYLNIMLSEGHTTDIRQEPKVNFNRKKYNAMWSNEEQEKYEAKCKETKSVYYLISKDFKYMTKINKTMFDYYEELARS